MIGFPVGIYFYDTSITLLVLDMKLYPPLPDLVLDNLPLIPWAFELCEMIGVSMAMIWFTVLVFHKERLGF